MKLKAIDAIVISGVVLAIVLMVIVYVAVDGPVVGVRSIEIHEIPTAPGERIIDRNP